MIRCGIAFGLLASAGAGAQSCTPGWLASPGVNGTIRDLMLWKGVVIAGGSFTQAGGTACSRVAAWDGGEWSPLGEGLGTFGSVNALAEYSGEVIAGGQFGFPGSANVNIARWDGTQWWPLGPSGLPGRVDELAAYHGELYSSGEGGMNRWNGATWQNMPLCCLIVYVPSLTVYNDRLIGAWLSNDGNFPELSRVRAWNGASWATLGTTMFGTADDMRVGVAAGALYVGAMDTPQRTVWRWTGTAWAALPSPPDTFQTWCIGEYQGNLVVCSATGPFLWDGTAWNTLAGGVDGGIRALVEYQGALVMGGSFQNAGGQPASRFARWGCPAPVCYPDCNGDGKTNLSDFGCFQTRFALGDPYADCNGDQALNLSDFGCFQTRFALGCP